MHTSLYLLLCTFLLHDGISFQVSTVKISKTRCHGHSPWREVEIDYSAANEYVDAHYGENSPSSPYFHRCVTDSSSDLSSTSNRVVEPIFDARKGIYDHDLEGYRTASLPLCGFSLLNLPSDVTDWNAIDQIQHVYLQELEVCIPSIFPGKQTRHVEFWNPMLRGEDYTIQRDYDDTSMSTSNVASTVHIDTDIGAFESLDEIVGMVENNRVATRTGGTDDFSRVDIIDSISNGHRFAIVNFWRNIDPRPVESAPLAILYTKYQSSSMVATKRGSFPKYAPDPTRSLWYTYPSMTKDECLFFLQYDRLLSQPSDLWHCALSNQSSKVPRRSFDIRALIVFDEKVPREIDRFSVDRPRPILSLEESGCFCEDQAASRVED